jgi:hypothetical protein
MISVDWLDADDPGKRRLPLPLGMAAQMWHLESAFREDRGFLNFRDAPSIVGNGD